MQNRTQQASTPKTLIVTALAPERRAAEKAVQEFGNGPERAFVFATTGIGNKNGHPRFTALLRESRPQELINVGLAGSLRSDLHPLDIFYPHEICSIENDTRMRFLPEPFAAPESWRSGILFTSDHPITTQSEKENLRSRSSADAVDMEAAGIAECCREQGIQYRVLKVISDTAEGDVRAQVEHRLQDCLARLTAALKILLSGTHQTQKELISHG